MTLRWPSLCLVQFGRTLRKVAIGGTAHAANQTRSRTGAVLVYLATAVLAFHEQFALEPSLIRDVGGPPSAQHPPRSLSTDQAEVPLHDVSVSITW